MVREVAQRLHKLGQFGKALFSLDSSSIGRCYATSPGHHIAKRRAHQGFHGAISDSWTVVPMEHDLVNFGENMTTQSLDPIPSTNGGGGMSYLEAVGVTKKQVEEMLARVMLAKVQAQEKSF